MLKNILLECLLIILVIILAFIVAIPIMILWNKCVPDITGWKQIGYWDAYYLYLLIYVMIPANWKELREKLKED
jgi:hypothetical protein